MFPFVERALGDQATGSRVEQELSFHLCVDLELASYIGSGDLYREFANQFRSLIIDDNRTRRHFIILSLPRRRHNDFISDPNGLR